MLSTRVAATPAVLPVLAICLAGACRHGGSGPAAPSVAEARAFHYQDNSGLLVGTYAAGARQALPAGVSVSAKALADYIVIDSRKVVDPGQVGPDRRPADVVTSASSTAGGGSVAREWRCEGLLDLSVGRDVRGTPLTIGGVVRGSTEPDYRSVSGALRAGAELLERNTSFLVQAGYGSDEVIPVEAPPQQMDLWPASHQRWSFTLSGTQLVSPRLVLVGAAGATFQRGMLASPYRRAVVKTTLYPERVPDDRDRFTALLGLSWEIRDDVAVHLKQGAYVDSWDVWALVPEIQVAAEVQPDVLLSAQYRLYEQGAASFYEAVYPEVSEIMTGDMRLGRIREHTLGLDVRWNAHTGARRPHMLPLLVSYALSLLDYRDIRQRVVAHIFGLGLEAWW